MYWWVPAEKWLSMKPNPKLLLLGGEGCDNNNDNSTTTTITTTTANNKSTTNAIYVVPTYVANVHSYQRCTGTGGVHHCTASVENTRKKPK